MNKVLNHWPRTDAEVDAMPIADLCGALSGTIDPCRVKYFGDRQRGTLKTSDAGEIVSIPKKIRRIGGPLTAEKRALILKLRFEGQLSLDATARQAGVSHRTVSRVIKDAGLSGRKPGRDDR